MDELNLKKFEKTNLRQEDRISVTSFRSFGFPTRFYQDNKIETYKYVVIYYDDKNKVVGFKFTNDEAEKHKFTIIKSKQGYGGSIVATSFFKAYKLNPKSYKGKYEWKRRNIKGVGQLFVIHLETKRKKENGS